MRALIYVVAIVSFPVVGSAAPTATTALTLAGYVHQYRASNNRLRARAYDVAIENVEIQRQTVRRTRELSLEPSFGGHLYHVSNPGELTPLGEVGGSAEYAVRGNTGIGYSVRADVNVPSSQNSQQNAFAGNLQYSIDGSFFLPLLRNLGGREFEYQQGAARARREVAEADLEYEAMLNCADALERYVSRYAAQEKRTAYQRLLQEKRRIWFRTAADYRKKLTTRLDLLAAKSDWIFAQSLSPEIELEVDRSHAALVAYAAPADYELAPPPNLGAAGTATTVFARHPRIRVFAAMTRSFRQEVMLANEQNRSELDLQFSAGVGRVHNLFVPPGNFADITDLRGTVGLRYLLPIERPDNDFRVQSARLRMKRIVEEQAQAERELLQDSVAKRAALVRQLEALDLLDKQVEVLRSQIKVAYQEFRAGKLEFQNYLDHWDRYQQARLSRWDRWRAAWLAEAALVRVNPELPEVCRAPNH